MATDKTADPRRVEYRRVADLQPDPRNPKAHATAEVKASIGRFGFIEPIALDGRTGYIISGHGRTEVLRTMEQEGENAPSGVKLDDEGRWTVPVVVGWESRTDTDAAGALIALNRTTEIGGWVDDELLDILDDLQTVDEGLAGVGYTDEEIDGLREGLDALSEQAPEDIFDEEDGNLGTFIDEEGKYTRDTRVPQYVPKEGGAKLGDLVERGKYDQLLAELDECDLDPEVKEFLKLAATRHLKFNYAKVADYYASASEEEQEHFEKSALVILDIDDAIANGFAKVSGRLAELLHQDPKVNELDEYLEYTGEEVIVSDDIEV